MVTTYLPLISSPTQDFSHISSPTRDFSRISFPTTSLPHIGSPAMDLTFVQVPNRLVSKKMYPISLGILYMAATARGAGAKVSIVDLRDRDMESLTPNPSWIPNTQYLCFTATTGEIGYAKRLAAMAKLAYPHIQTVIGGSHATALPLDCTQHFDVVATGEWDFGILNLLRGIHPPGIAHSEPVPYLDLIPFPARELAGEGAFSETLMPGEGFGIGEKAAMIMSSRGCPMVPSCAFCANMFKPPVRFRSPENVVEEVWELKDRYSCSAFRDESDNITANKKWLLKYCNLLSPLRVHWKGHTRADLLDEDMVIGMRESGLVEMGIGIESADPIVLKLANKRETVDQFLDAVALLKKHKILTKVYLVMGLPGETELTLKLNAEFMEKAKPDKWTCGHFVPYPGCEVWENPGKFGAVIHKGSFGDYWNFFGQSVIEYAHINRKELDYRHERMVGYLRSDIWRHTR